MSRFILLLTLSTCLFACENKKHGDSASSVPTPSPQQQKLMDKSWLEYIVTVTNSAEVVTRGGFTLEKWNDNFKTNLVVKKIKPFTKNKVVITLDKKTKYKLVYQSLMPLPLVESIQPNFIYNIPQPVLKIDAIQAH